MKSTGIVRRIDDLGRIVIPKELRRTFGIDSGDPVEIFTTADKIVLRKYVPPTGCTFCNTVADRYAELGQYRICPECARLIKERMQHG